MNMDGVMGELVLNNIDEKSYNLLKLGEIIGVGKQTVLGLGKIEVEEF
jgi:CRISPR/Cas system endoribonuclease Cas6 (RAMP superfamily)